MKCELCGKPAEVKATWHDPAGVLLAIAYWCRECARAQAAPWKVTP